WQAVCVDEFQDTDPLQVELVHLVTGLDHGSWKDATVEGGRLFFVGDPKQSIYRFRRAEVALFAEVSRVYAAGRLGLVRNFRSRPGVLAVVNAVFTRVFGDDATVGFAPLQAARPGVDADTGPDVLLLGGPADKRIGAIREDEADHVAATLARARGRWQVGGPPTTARRASYGDMAILVPTRTSLGPLEDALDHHGVPYRVMSRSLIWESDAVRDLVTVLQAVDDPADAVALVAALRHPMFGCSDDDLVAWKAAGGRWRYDAPPPEGCEDAPVAEAMAALRLYHDLRWWLPVNVLLDRVVRERRGVELTAAHRRPRDHWRRLRFLVDQARLFLDSGGAGLTGFVRWAREQIESAADAVETVTPERDDDAVQILTIHGAKGLEFPVLALSGINSPPITRSHVIWSADAPPEVDLFKGFETPGHDDAQKRERDLDAQENLRLLYVGMTRAADHLVVSLYHRPSKGAKAPNSHAMRLDGMREALTAAGAVHEPAAPASKPADAAPATTSVADGAVDGRAAFLAARAALLTSVTGRLPMTATGLAAAAAAATAATVDEETAGEVDASQEPSDPLEDASQSAPDGAETGPVARSGATLGSAVHRALEIVDLAEPSEPAVRRAVDAACAELGVVRLSGEAASRVRAALAAPIVRLAASRRHWKEVPVVVELDGRVVEGFVDLVVDTDDGLVVVDYKTDGVRSASEREVTVQRYAPQLHAYADALARATGLPVAPPQLLFCRPDGAESVSVPGDVRAIRGS
ncbi:MAG: 3'-5' exonuclease, partial [Actinomycetes bacterium]